MCVTIFSKIPIAISNSNLQPTNPMLKSSSDSNKNPRPVWLVKRNANKPMIDVEAFSPLPEWESAQPDLFPPARLAQGKDHGFASNNCFSLSCCCYCTFYHAVHRAICMYFCVKGSLNNLVNKRMFIPISDSLGRVICGTEKQQSFTVEKFKTENGWSFWLTNNWSDYTKMFPSTFFCQSTNPFD